MSNEQSGPYYRNSNDLAFTPRSREEIFALVKTWQDSDPANPGPEAMAARDILATQYLKLVAKLAIQTARKLMTHDQAISAGNYGLMMALDKRKFDFKRNTSFTTYLRWYVRKHVFKALEDIRKHSSHLERPTRETRPEENTLTGAVARDNSGADKDDVEMPGFEGEEVTANQKRVVKKVLKKLPPLERAAVEGKFFLGKDHVQVGKENGVSREAVRKALGRGMLKIQRAVRRTPREDLV